MPVHADPVPSLLRAIIRLDGRSMVARVGSCPYVVTATGHVPVGSRALPKAAIDHLLADLLSPQAQATLRASGAVVFDLPPRPDMEGEQFTVIVTDHDGPDLRIQREPADHAVPGGPQAAAPRFPPLVLLIDDSIDQLDLYEFALMGRYQFLGASDGAAGVALAVERQPDAILIDIGMPHVDGWEVCRQLKGNPLTARMPVMFLTADRRSGVDQMARQSGAQDLLYKPCPMDVLRDRLDAVISHGSSWRREP
jgi:CheY-like chemotaxis protein